MSFVTWLALGALTAQKVLADDPPAYPTCLSYGMDFQNGGFYFQNSLSTEPFTFVTQFDECQNDVAYNFLIDPTGAQYQCSNTTLQPDDTNMLSSCPISKNQLVGGAWSVVVISNNGKADPIAYERDFSLSVGPQQTSTFTPTATVAVISTPILSITSTSTETLTTVLPPSTVISPSTTVTPTITVTPARVTTTTTKALLTIKLTSFDLQIGKTTSTRTASCKIPTRAATVDPVATARITIGPAATIISSKFRREAEEQNARFLEARRVRILQRAPDPQPLIVTETNTANWPTVTTTSIGPTATVTATTALLTTFTSTPTPVTVLSGTQTASVVTTTAPPATRTVTKYNIPTIWTTTTLNLVYTITIKTTPAEVASACKTAGGILY